MTGQFIFQVFQALWGGFQGLLGEYALKKICLFKNLINVYFLLSAG